MSRERISTAGCGYSRTSSVTSTRHTRSSARGWPRRPVPGLAVWRRGGRLSVSFGGDDFLLIDFRGNVQLELPVAGAAVVVGLPRRRSELVVPVAFALSTFTFALAAFVVWEFEPGDGGFQFIESAIPG